MAKTGGNKWCDKQMERFEEMKKIQQFIVFEPTIPGLKLGLGDLIAKAHYE